MAPGGKKRQPKGHGTMAPKLVVAEQHDADQQPPRCRKKAVAEPADAEQRADSNPPRHRKRAVASKRPRAAFRVKPPDQEAAADDDDQQPEQSVQIAGGLPMPDWAEHFVNLLADGFRGFHQKTGGAQELKLSVWSDCGGMGTEATALRKLAQSVKRLTNQQLIVETVCFCDKKLSLQNFADRSHKPLHISNDIFARKFDDRTFRCLACQADHPFPPKVDIYVCCFPCGPWSMKGARMGFNDRDGEIVWQAAKTINALAPGVWYMENVMGLSTSKTAAKGSDLQVITGSLREKVPGYHIMCLQGVDPIHWGFPVHRSRVVLIGVAHGLATEQAMADCFNKLLSNPLPPCSDWRAFVGRADVPKCDFSTLFDHFKADAEAADRIGPHCTCSVDPMQDCAVHPCRCQHCAKGKKCACGWRNTHMAYIHKHAGEYGVWAADQALRKTYPSFYNTCM